MLGGITLTANGGDLDHVPGLDVDRLGGEIGETEQHLHEIGRLRASPASPLASGQGSAATERLAAARRAAGAGDA